MMPRLKYNTLLILCLISGTVCKSQSSLDFWEIDSLGFHMDASRPVVEKMLARTASGSGDYYFLQALSSFEEHDSALHYFKKAQELYLEAGDTLAGHIARAHQATTFWKQSRYQEALEVAQEELEYAVLHQHPYLRFYALISLFKTHYQLNNFLKANEYLEEARISQVPANEASRIKLLYYKMVLYQSLVMAKLELDSGYATNAQCIKLADRVIPLLEEYNYHCLLSKAWVIRTFSLYEGELAGEDSCIASLDRALQIALDGNCPEPFEFALANKARYLAKLGRSLDDSEGILKMLNSQPENLSHLGWTHQLISSVYAGQGEWEKAYRALRKSGKYHMQVYSHQNAEALAAQAVKFETFQKDLENEKLAAQIAFEVAQKEKLRLYFSLVLLVLMAAASIYWIHYRNKIRHREQQIITRHLLEGEQKERMRVARDLHDSVGQLLSALKLQFSGIGGANAQNQAQTEKILDKTIEEVRSISHNLLPKALDYFGLEKAIEDMAEQYNSTGTVNIEVNVVGRQRPVEFSKHQQLMIFRIVQENVQNIIKHSSSEEIGIGIFNREDELAIDISYFGPCMSFDKIVESKGIGWENIMARIKILRGEISFDWEGEESVIKMRLLAG